MDLLAKLKYMSSLPRYYYNKIKNYITSDVDLEPSYSTYYCTKTRMIDGFHFTIKKKFSNRYQFHTDIDIENIDLVLGAIESCIKNNKKYCFLKVNRGIGYEVIIINKRNLRCASALLRNLKVRVENGE